MFSKQVTYFNHASRKESKIALTFDDGPNPPRTEQIMEILHLKNAVGTFFLLGNAVDRWPRTAIRLAQSGHLIGNHGYGHLKGICDFAKGEASIGHVTGQSTRFIRAPYFDCTSYNNLHPQIQESTIRVHADVHSQDFKAISAKAILDNVLKSPSLAGGSIIALHDGSEDPDDGLRLARPLALIEALPIMIDELRAMGYELVRLDELKFTDRLKCRSTT